VIFDVPSPLVFPSSQFVESDKQLAIQETVAVAAMSTSQHYLLEHVWIKLYDHRDIQKLNVKIWENTS
jgi:hypothetical protein